MQVTDAVSVDGAAAAEDDNPALPSDAVPVLRWMREMLPAAAGELCSAMTPTPTHSKRQRQRTCSAPSSHGRLQNTDCVGPAAAEPGDGADRRGDDGSDDDEARDTPQQHAGSLVWDASGLEAPARVMAQHGIADVCAALLVHSRAVADGAHALLGLWGIAWVMCAASRELVSARTL